MLKASWQSVAEQDAIYQCENKVDSFQLFKRPGAMFTNIHRKIAESYLRIPTKSFHLSQKFEHTHIFPVESGI